LRIATYELKNRVDIPYKVVINESVNLSKKFGPEESHKFINGMLDKLAHKLRTVEISNQN
jgi:N utilization substance protein B